MNRATLHWIQRFQEEFRRCSNPELYDRITENQWLVVVVKALESGRRDPPRYQVRLEKFPDQPTNCYRRTYVIRAASGHRALDILDPGRIAACISHDAGGQAD